MLICLDADDTLWHSEVVFRRTLDSFIEMLSPYADAATIASRVDATEHANLRSYGYGAKGFILSLVEVACGLAGERLSAALVERIMVMGKEMLEHPLEKLEGIDAALDDLDELGRLVLLTKGDLWHQEAKLAASGLGDYFTGVEIVSDKTPATYRRIFDRYGARPDETLMAGNSMRSDILPALEAGAWAAFVPFEIVWSHEVAEAPVGNPRYKELKHLGELAEWVKSLP